MEINPIKELGQEHFHILQMIDVISPVVQKLKYGEVVEIGHLRKIVDFIVNYADRLHHGKEEVILFEGMVKKPGVNLGLINELLGEHRAGRDLINGLKVSLESYAPVKPEAFHIATSLDHYRQLISEHIKKENGLFAQAMQLLSTGEQAEIESRFGELEKSMGEILAQSLQNLEELKRVYLIAD